TARVIVNRIWYQHFGQGIVSTPNNFGKMGTQPSHPELLDWLATEFVRRGWSIKALHRILMLSTAYRQSSRPDPTLHVADPDNSLLSRFPMHRMGAESRGDAILRVSGRLDPRRFGPADEVETRPDGEVVTASARRSVYLLQR